MDYVSFMIHYLIKKIKKISPRAIIIIINLNKE